MHSTLAKSMLTLTSEITCPRYFVDVLANEHLDLLQYSWLSAKILSTVCKCCA